MEPMAEELSTDNVWRIAREILRYLECHPEAKDTMDGTVQWWLRQQGNARWRQDVQRAVAVLCSRSLILETRRTGVPPYYQLNPQQREAITKVLEGASRLRTVLTTGR